MTIEFQNVVAPPTERLDLKDIAPYREALLAEAMKVLELGRSPRHF